LERHHQAGVWWAHVAPLLEIWRGSSRLIGILEERTPGSAMMRTV
jgi:hypothetical protein